MFSGRKPSTRRATRFFLARTQAISQTSTLVKRGRKAATALGLGTNKVNGERVRTIMPERIEKFRDAVQPVRPVHI